MSPRQVCVLQQQPVCMEICVPLVCLSLAYDGSAYEAPEHSTSLFWPCGHSAACPLFLLVEHVLQHGMGQTLPTSAGLRTLTDAGPSAAGLDARAAAIVMRTVRNIVNTGRTIVCTIHQPSIDIFEVKPLFGHYCVHCTTFIIPCSGMLGVDLTHHSKT